LRQLDLPALLIWGQHDAITAPAEAHLRSIFRNPAPTVWVNAGHFIQEDAGVEVAHRIAAALAK
jgi:pimeloyl-ACP methyl ester carboxylesterase